MKKTDIARHRWTLIIGIVVVIFSAAGGRLKGTADGRSGARMRNPSLDRSEQADDIASGAEKRPQSSDGNPALTTEKIHQRLWAIWRESPEPNNDPEAGAKIGRLVAGMSSAQIEEFLGSMPLGSVRGADFGLRLLILRSWVLQDGPAALAYIGTGKDAGTSSNGHFTTQLAMQWASDQPDAAFAWMNDETLPPELKKRAANIRLNSLMNLMDTDTDRAFQELSRMRPDDVSKQLKLWAGTHGTQPEVREKLLEYAARTANPETLEEIRSTLVRTMAEKDPVAAKELMDSLKPAAADPTALELAAMLGRARKEPKAEFDEWLEKTDVSAGIPESVTFGIGSWMWNQPEEVIKWLDGQPPGEKRDTLCDDSIPALAGFEHFDKAAKIATSIGSPDLRASALQALDLRWSLANHDAADKWKQSLSPEDRELLGK